MIEQTHGSLEAAALSFAIVASRFNDEVVSKLIDGAVECLLRHGAQKESVAVYRVPGAFEIPITVAKLADSKRFDAVIALGALIRGDTPHFDFIALQATLELSRVAVDARLPVAFGVLTCNTMEQALHRTQKGNNKGWEAALAAIEMSSLFRKIVSPEY